MRNIHRDKQGEDCILNENNFDNNGKISIIIPIYNVENYLNKCVDSVLNQKYSNIEIILVNDGSTDSSGKICDQYKKQDSRIKVIHQKNQGVSIARNKGLNNATGNLIGFVDSDDWIKNDMFEILYKSMTKFNADISVCGYSAIREDDEINKDDCIIQDHFFKVLEGKDKLKYFLSNYEYCIYDALWNKLYKRSLFDKIRFPPNKLYEDVFVIYLLLDNAQKIVLSSKKEYNHIIRNHSISNQATFDLIEANLQRYEYIKSLDLRLENLCRKILLKSIIYTLYTIEENKFLNTNKKQQLLKKIYNVIKIQDIHNCGLTRNQIYFLESFLKNDRGWIIAIKTINNEGSFLRAEEYK